MKIGKSVSIGSFQSCVDDALRTILNRFVMCRREIQQPSQLNRLLGFIAGQLSVGVLHPGTVAYCASAQRGQLSNRHRSELVIEFLLGRDGRKGFVEK